MIHLTIFFVLALSLFLSGCTKNGPTADGPGAPVKIKIGFLVKQPEEPWFQFEWGRGPTGSVRGPTGSVRELLTRFSRGPTGSVRELLTRFSGDRRLFDIPKIGVRARSLPNLGRTGLSRWLDDCAFSFPAQGIT
jgi:hypothetical protein